MRGRSMLRNRSGMSIFTFDLSDAKDLRSIADVVRTLSNAADGVADRWLIVGATARDLILQHVYHLPASRKTADLDIAVAVPSWQAFGVLQERLIGDGAERDHKTSHRFLLHDWKIDIVPFGGVEKDGLITWPPDGDTAMSVVGFEEVSLHAFEVCLPGGVRAFVASPAGLLILKVIAWEERHRALPHHDAVDIRTLIDSYDGQWNQERLYEEADDLLQRFGFDNALASAALLGRDAAAIAQPATLNRIKSIVEREVSNDALVLASDMGKQASNNLSLLEAVLVGFQEVVVSRK